MNKFYGILLQGAALLAGVLLLNTGVVLHNPALISLGGVITIYALARAFVLRRNLDRGECLAPESVPRGGAAEEALR